MYVCEACRKQVRPKSETEILFARLVVPVPSFGAANDVAQGQGVFFHERCYPAHTIRYRRKPMPADIDDGNDY